MSDTRNRLLEEIRRSPGVHFRGLVRALDLAPGQVQYHLKQLRRTDRVTTETFAGRTHYYDPQVDATERQQLAILRRETARDIVITLSARGPSAPDTVCEHLEIARSTLEFHVDRLTDANLVEKSYDPNGRVTLSVTDHQRIAHLLDAVRPGLPARLTDRFTRLVDQLLEE